MEHVNRYPYKIKIIKYIFIIPICDINYMLPCNYRNTDVDINDIFNYFDFIWISVNVLHVFFYVFI